MAQNTRQGDHFQFGFPKGYDQTQLKKFADRVKAEYRKEHQARADQLVKDVSALTDISIIHGRALGLDQKAAEKGSREAQRKIKSASAEGRPPGLDDILKINGHNPTRFPPYDGAGAYSSNGGLYTFESHGPDRVTGQTGAILQAETAGHAYIAHDVGAFFFSTTNATLRVTVNAFVWGVATIYSPLLAYATAYAGLRASISQWYPYRHVSAETVIYNAGSVVAANIWRTAGWASYSATVTMPVLADTVYYLSGGAVQNVATGGLLFPYAKSSFFMPVRPIAFEVI